MLITSLENERVKKYLKLKEKKYRDKYNEFLVEGEHLVLEAYKAGLIKELILQEGLNANIDISHIIYLSTNIIKKISNVDSPQKIMALCEKMENNSNLKNKILIIDNIQDPGNLGTIIRSAVAFNIDTIVLSEDCVDLYNPKVIRATQGILFHISIIKKDLKEVLKELHKENITIYKTDVTNGIDARNLSLKEREKYALVIGNEGNGVRKYLEPLCDKNLYIPMNSKAESLNVAIATSIILYELGR